jgi:hypothetical protein
VAEATPSFVWPPPESEVESSFERLELVEAPTVDPDEWSATQVDSTAFDWTDDTSVEPVRMMAAPRHAAFLRRPVLAILAVGAALVGASIAWFTRPLDPVSDVQQSPASAGRSVDLADAPSDVPESGLRRAPTRPAGRTAEPTMALRSRSTSARPDAIASVPVREIAKASPATILRVPAQPAPSVSAPLPPPPRLEEAAAPTSLTPGVLSGISAVAAPSAVAVPAAETAFAQERTAIQQVLAQYQRAYDELDAGAASAVWPSVDAAALERAFAGIKEQSLAFDRCDVKLASNQATAVCPGSLSFVRRVGSTSREVRRVSWTFALQRVSDNWQIARVTAR